MASSPGPLAPARASICGRESYRYYVSRAKLTGRGEAGSLHRISAGVLEQFLAHRITPLLSPSWRPQPEAIERVAPAVRQIVMGAEEILVDIHAESLSAAALSSSSVLAIEDDLCQVRLPFHSGRRKGAILIEPHGTEAVRTPKVDRALVRAVVLAKSWARQLEAGEVRSVTVIAEREGLCRHYTARLLPLAFLSPAIVEDILHGRQPRTLTLARLTSEPLPLRWLDQSAFVARLAAC